MSRISHSRPNFLGGLYQLPSKEIPINGAAAVMDNTMIRRMGGVRKRPPTFHQAIIDSDTTPPGSELFTHHVKRSETDKYSVAIMDGELLVYDSITGAQKLVVTPHGMDYLTTFDGFRAATIGDTTIIVNKSTTVGKVAGRAPGKKYEATVQVREANYSNTYTITFDSHAVAYTTRKLGTDSADQTLATQVVAQGLYSAIKTNQYVRETYDVIYFGNVMHFARKDGEDFRITVADSLGDKGLKLVKDTAQVFEDLPPVAKEGMIIRLVGDLTTGKDDYWVKFETLRGFEEMGGVWKECPAPGSTQGLDPETMPWALTRYGSHVGRRTVLKDPLAPEIRSYHFRDFKRMPYGLDDFDRDGNTMGWNSLDESVEFLLSDDDSVTDSITPTGANVDTGHYWMGMIYFDVDATELEEDQRATLTLERWTGTWDAVDFVTFYPGQIVKNGYLRSGQLPDDPTEFWRCKLTYWRPAGSSTTTKAHITMHAGTHPTHPGIWLFGDPHYTVTYDPTVYYPEGHVERLKLTIWQPVWDGVSSHILTAEVTVGSGGLSGSAMQAAIIADINAEAAAGFGLMSNFFATNELDHGAFIYLGPGTEPGAGGNLPNDRSELFFVERAFTRNTDACHLDGPEFTAGSLDGMDVNNLTDGSSGVILEHGPNYIVTSGLTGGVLNTFSPGDEIEIIGESGDYFVFDMIRWTDRLAGDDLGCPLPSFTGKKISEVFFHGDRLGFCSGENVVLSASGDLFRFVRKTNSQLLADDPVDVRHSYKSIAAFAAAVEWEGSMFLFSDAGHEFRLSGDPVITPATVRLDHVGSHPCSASRFRPVAIGNKLYFSRKVGDYSRILEGSLTQDADGNLQMLAKDITTHVPRYLKGNVVDLAGDSSAGLLGVLTDGDDRENIYMWTFEADDEGRPLNAWCRWTFGAPVWAMDMAEGYMYLAVVRDADPVYGYGGVCLERLDLMKPTTQGDTDHRDRRGIINISPMYLMQIGIPTLYATRPDGTLDINAQLVIQHLSVHYADAGQFVVKTRSTPRPITTEFSLFTTGNKVGTMRVPFFARNTDYIPEASDIVIQCDHFYGIAITGLDWSGYYVKREV